MKKWAFVTLLAVGLGSVVAAHERATGVVKERMEKMERFEELIERVFAMIHGEIAYDARAVRSAAEEIQAGAGQHMIALFPEDSNSSPSEAKNEIWRDFETFEHLAFLLESWSGELAAQADGIPRGTLPKKWEDAEMGPAMMQSGGMMRDGGPVFAAWHVAATCNACHTEFREED
jgi:cytochrome c556